MVLQLKKSFTASDHVRTSLNTTPSRYTKSLSIAATDLSSFNTNLAAALNGDTFTFDISHTELLTMTTLPHLQDTELGVLYSIKGTVSFTVVASVNANDTGVDLNILPTNFTASGIEATLNDPNNVFLFPFTNKNYVTSLSGTYGSLASDRYMELSSRITSAQ